MESYKDTELYKVCCDFLVCDGLAYFRAMKNHDSDKPILHARYFAEQNMAKSVLSTLPGLDFTKACDIVEALNNKLLDSLLLKAYGYTSADGDTYVVWAKTKKEAQGYLEVKSLDEDAKDQTVRLPWADGFALYGDESNIFKSAALRHGWYYGCYFCCEMQTSEDRPHVFADGSVVCRHCYEKRYGGDDDEV